MAKHSVELVQQLKQSLGDMPQPDRSGAPISAHQAVAMLADEVRGLQDKGYTYAMIAEVLSAGGLKIAGGTLCTYMSRLARSRTYPTSNGRPLSKPLASHSDTVSKTVSKLPNTNANIGASPTLQSSAKFSPAPDTEDL